jgi:PglZ domain
MMTGTEIHCGARPSLGGPVSETLEADLRTWVQRQGVVLWLDLDGYYASFVEQLSALNGNGGLPYHILSYQGSHLELLVKLEDLTNGADKPKLVIHLPGFNEESVRETPLLELYAAGARYRKSLGTLIEEAAAGQVRPEEVAAFLEQPDLTLEQADAWLTAIVQGDEGELAGHLRAMTLPAITTDLLGNGYVAQRLSWTLTQDALWRRIEAASGLPAPWREACVPQGSNRAEDMAFALASWALSVEYVDDLRRPPVSERLAGTKDLPRKTIDDCRALAEHLRATQAAFYTRTADETEAWLSDEIEVARAEDLGKIDTFRFEDDKVLSESLGALSDARFADALEWARLRIEGASFWLRETPSRRSAWELVREAALLGQTIEAAGPGLNASDLTRAVERYQKHGAEVDRCHRRLEQQRSALLYAQLPEFETLRARLDELRARWRQWADAWARDFNKLCRQEGFLPPAALQQRELFEEVVRPLTQEPGITALFIIDAFRYEMGAELFQALDGTPATTVHLDARLAELPTITSVGMNVLAPVAIAGNLRPALSKNAVLGFSTGEYRVANGETRRRAMQGRVGGATCPLLNLSDVLGRDATSLKQSIARARLVVVHATEIDDAGEKGVGPSVFQQVLQKLRAAWRVLRDAGVRRFVFTSDHGFLMLDPTAKKAQPHGRKIDPRRRHVFSEDAADIPGEVRVALADLRYEGVSGHLMFPDSTAVFDTGRRKMSFVHGGNSLQERVIPVLTVVHRAARGASTLRYRIDAQALDDVAGMQCLSATVTAVAQTSLDFGGVKELELGLHTVDAGDDIQVELCQTRGAARLAGGAVVAEVNRPFELFFRLLGRTNARVQVELGHSGAQAEVIAGLVEHRFPVAPDGRDYRQPEPSAVPDARSWLDKLPEGVRELFNHLAEYGAVKEDEAATMLGSPRAVRQFARRFEEFAACAPFAVHIQVSGGIKRYVRDGSE